MKVEIYVIAYNEEVMLPYFIKHYQTNFPGCKIIVYDNRSTDNTRRIANYYGCKIEDLFTGDKMNDFLHMFVKNHAWNESGADWVFCLDADEICDIKMSDLVKLDKQGINLVKFQGFEMFGDTYNPELCKEGCYSPGYSKPVLFKRECFQEIRFTPGAHSCDPVMNNGFGLNISDEQFYLFHHKWWNWHYGIGRARLLAARQSEDNIKNGHSIHFAFPEEVHRKYYEDGMENKIIIKK